MEKEYRVRKGLFGRSILQIKRNTPSYIGGHVDSSIRDIYWEDVKFDRAPASLSEQREHTK